MKLLRPRDLVLAVLLLNFLVAVGFSNASGQTTPRPLLIPFDGTTPREVAATLNLAYKMALLKQD